jgi:hypothetical protein
MAHDAQRDDREYRAAGRVEKKDGLKTARDEQWHERAIMQEGVSRFASGVNVPRLRCRAARSRHVHGASAYARKTTPPARA